VAIARLFLLGALLLLVQVNGFQVAISDRDQLRQTCSGMWKGKDTRIELHFDNGSAGTVSTLIYEFADFQSVGKEGKERDMFGFPLKTYICTSQAVLDGLCQTSDLGSFIVAKNAPSIATKRVDLGTGSTAEANVVVSSASLCSMGL
jgi:hypothetical protein